MWGPLGAEPGEGVLEQTTRASTGLAIRERLSESAFSFPPGLRNSKASKRPTPEFGPEEESPLHHPGK